MPKQHRTPAAPTSPWFWLFLVTAMVLLITVVSFWVRTPTDPAGAIPAQTTRIPDRWLTARPVATIPIEYQPDGPPEENPELTLVLNMYDATTGHPVPATVWLNGLKVGKLQTSYTARLRMIEPGEKQLQIRVEAIGYQPWEYVARIKILYSRRMEVPIELEPFVKPGKGV